MKKIHKVLILVNVILIAIILAIRIAQPRLQLISSELTTYEEVEDHFSKKLSSVDEITDNEFSGIVYFGRDTCPNCLMINSFIQEVYEENENLIIHKFDTDYFRGMSGYEEVISKYDIQNIPSLIKIKNGEIKDRFEFKEELVKVEEIQESVFAFLTSD